MNKTLALLYDTYRELNAKRLFWIVLGLSGFVVCAFAIIGIKRDTITLFGFNTPIRAEILNYLTPATLYKDMFEYFGIGFWLSWIGNILALISTAGMFPDFLAAGSIDLYLSKPISRLRLFLTKYLGGLLFVTLQVTIFSFCSFLVLGFRGHSWEPKIFLSIPLVVLVFSYLFSVCVLMGVMTRSTIAALLITLLFWFTVWGVHVTETALLMQSIQDNVEVADIDRQIQITQLQLKNYVPPRPATTPAPSSALSGWNPLAMFAHTSTSRSDMENRLATLESRRAEYGTGIHTAHEVAFAALTPLPKTSATTDLLTRALSDSDQKIAAEALEDQHARRPRGPGPQMNFTERRTAQEQLVDAINARTATWTIGTSLAFELVVMGLAAWLFCRRDY